MNVIISMIILFCWGLINEYLHYTYWDLSFWIETHWNPPPDLICSLMLFEISIYLIGVIIILAVIFLCFSDEIEEGIKYLYTKITKKDVKKE